MAWKAKALSAALAATNTKTKADTAESAPSPASPCVIHFASADCVILGYFREWPGPRDHAFALARLIEIKPCRICAPNVASGGQGAGSENANAGSALATGIHMVLIQEIGNPPPSKAAALDLDAVDRRRLRAGTALAPVQHRAENHEYGHDDSGQDHRIDGHVFLLLSRKTGCHGFGPRLLSCIKSSPSKRSRCALTEINRKRRRPCETECRFQFNPRGA